MRLRRTSRGNTIETCLFEHKCPEPWLCPLVTSGACGELNPPAENVPPGQMAAWGTAIADAIAPRMRAAGARPATFTVAHDRVPVPLEVLSRDEVERFAAGALQDRAANAAWGARYHPAVANWRCRQLEALARGNAFLALSFRTLRRCAPSTGETQRDARATIGDNSEMCRRAVRRAESGCVRSARPHHSSDFP